jgi:uncharacterized damage-inducible protein DinB
MNSYSEQLLKLSQAVRTSTIERLIKVPTGKENWRISTDSMSFADIAAHLIDTDEWLIKQIKKKNLKPILGKAGSVEIGTYTDFIALIDNLKISGERRADFIGKLNETDLQEKIFDERFGKEVSVWWIIVRGNLDHEIHHRGQISAYLRAIET